MKLGVVSNICDDLARSFTERGRFEEGVIGEFTSILKLAFKFE